VEDIMPGYFPALLPGPAFPSDTGASLVTIYKETSCRTDHDNTLNNRKPDFTDADNMHLEGIPTDGA
jgi:hypothetical protein